MNGWMKIKGYSRGGGCYHTRYLSQFGDLDYEDVRIENHSMIDQTVRVRDPRVETGQGEGIATITPPTPPDMRV